MSETETITKRSEFILLFDVVHGNPNGDPDAGNAPRVDPETGLGLVTDVCLKRKIRNYIALTRSYQPPHDIYVKERGILANEQKRAYRTLAIDATDRPNEAARRWICQTYFDVRTFGAVMTTGKAEETDESQSGGKRTAKKTQKLWNCGQVRGPVQMGFGQSQSRILSLEHTITRAALTNAGDTDRTSSGEEDEKAASGQMGRKHTVPYALYRTHGFISPFLARDTGFSQSDQELLFEALSNMFDHDHSAARGEMSVRGLYMFEHDSPLGNAPSHVLFDTLRITGPAVARSFSDYSVTTPTSGDLPEGVTLKRIC